jgi:hypothetical protein
VKNSQSLPGIEPPIIRPVAQRYTTLNYPSFYGLDDQGSIPGWGWAFFSSPTRPERL